MRGDRLVDGSAGAVEVFFADVGRPLHGDEARLEDDGDRGAVGDRPGEVVDVDVVPEDIPGVAVDETDGSAREGDHGGVRQGLAQPVGEAIETVMATVGLIDHDDDVVAIRQEGVVRAGLAFGVGETELLQGREVDATAASRGQRVA